MVMLIKGSQIKCNGLDSVNRMLLNKVIGKLLETNLQN